MACVLPASLTGTLYRVGPGRFERGGVRYAHILDGDGRVDRIVFKGGRLSVSSRFVETPEYLREQAAEEVLHRGAFGTGPYCRLRTLKNAANTALVMHGGELLALWEGGHASALCPETLAYLGPHSLGGAATVAPAFSVHGALDSAMGLGGDAVGAHSRVDPATGVRTLLLTRRTLSQTTLRFVEFAPHSFKVLSECVHVVPWFTHVHDFALTPQSVVFFTPRLRFDALAFRGGKGALDCVGQHPGPTELVALPRAGGRAVCTRVPQFFATHFINAYHAPGVLVADCFGVDSLWSGVSPASFGPRRVVVSAHADAPRVTKLDESTSEFPCVSLDHQGSASWRAYYAGTTVGLMDSLVWLDSATGERRVSRVEGAFHLEPVIAGDFLLVFALLGKEQMLRVFERETMREVSRVRVEGTNALGLHSTWVPS